MSAEILLAAALAAPLAMLLACLSGRARDAMPAPLSLAPIPALAAALLVGDGAALRLGSAHLQLTFALDRPGAVLLGVAALLWIAAGAYAAPWLRGAPNRGRFVACWLMTLTGCIGVFMAADLVGFYFLLAVLSLGASGLVVHDQTPEARRAAAAYLGLALLAETSLLIGLVLLASAPGDSLLIRDAVAALPASPRRDLTLALLIAGLGMKAGLVPLHVWMPLAYGAAPIPAAAVLSGAVVKASILGLIRLVPIEAALPDWGAALAAIGLFGAFYGVAVGITQTHPKVVLAYSSVSQMGFIVAVLGMAMAAGDGGAVMATAFYAAHHVLAKGALFLAVGVIAASGERRLWPALLPAAVLALGIGGLPLTGGALAKLAVKAPLGEGAVGMLAALVAAGSTLLMMHFLFRLVPTAAANPEATPPAGLAWPWLAMACAAVAVPWALYPAAGIGTLADAFAPATLWAALWPVLLGIVLAIGLRRWRHRLPRVPAGDVVVVGARLARAGVAWGASLERAEGVLRQWPVAGMSLLALVVALGALMLGHASQALP